MFLALVVKWLGIYFLNFDLFKEGLMYFQPFLKKIIRVRPIKLVYIRP